MKFKFIAILAVFTFTAWPGILTAAIKEESVNRAKIINSVKVQADTGSSSRNRQEKTGSSSAKAEIFATVNGETVIDEKITEAENGKIEILLNNEVSEYNNDIKSQTKIEKNGEITTEQKIIKDVNESGAVSLDQTDQEVLSEKPAQQIIPDENPDADGSDTEEKTEENDKGIIGLIAGFFADMKDKIFSLFA